MSICNFTWICESLQSNKIDVKLIDTVRFILVSTKKLLILKFRNEIIDVDMIIINYIYISGPLYFSYQALSFYITFIIEETEFITFMFFYL